MKKVDTEGKLKVVIKGLDDKKGMNILAFNVTEQSGYTDYMVFVTGTSSQHNKTLYENILRELKKNGYHKPIVEGAQTGKWVLIDAGDIVVNVMLDEIRHHYDLESIWSENPLVDIQKIMST